MGSFLCRFLCLLHRLAAIALFFVSSPSPDGDCVATKPSRLLLQNEGDGRGSGSRMAWVWLSDGVGLALGWRGSGSQTR